MKTVDEHEREYHGASSWNFVCVLFRIILAAFFTFPLIPFAANFWMALFTHTPFQFPYK